MSEYGEPWKTSRPTECGGKFAYLDRADAAFSGDTATFWSVGGDAMEHADRAKDCVNFCAGHAIPEGEDAPTLADVLGALNIAILGWDEGAEYKGAYLRKKNGDDIGLAEARAILAAFKPVAEPTQEGK